METVKVFNVYTESPVFIPTADHNTTVFMALQKHSARERVAWVSWPPHGRNCPLATDRLRFFIFQAF